MDIDMLIRISAVALAAVLLISTVNFSYWIDKVKNLSIFKRKPKPDTPEVDETIDEAVVEVDDNPFLEIVDPWYSLRGKCLEEGLESAVVKLDEVFPLFNSENSHEHED